MTNPVRTDITPKVLKQPHFVGSWKLQDTKICDELINYFENNTSQHAAGKAGDTLNAEVKSSTDLTIAPNDIQEDQSSSFQQYFKELNSMYDDYREQWPFLKKLINRIEIGPFNIQRYTEGQHFLGLHTERGGLSTLHRVFAWMTYLNDVDEGGSTFFSHYDLSVQPKKGLTLIWPAEWTHAHRGNAIEAGQKYIITGWMDFAE